MSDDDAVTVPVSENSGDGELARAALEGTQAVVLIFDERGHCVKANPAVIRALGWTAEELSARPFWEVYVAPEHVVRARQAFTLALEQGLAFPQEGDWLDQGGTRHRVRMQNDVLRDSQGRPCALVTVGMDVTHQHSLEARLRQRAEIDQLTGLCNRSAFFEHLTTALHTQEGHGVGLLFCDLDDFKQVNDEHGHHMGDLLLTHVARRLREACAPGQQAARFGGDEFVILFPSADEQRLSHLAERISGFLRQPIITAYGTVSTGVSVGWAISHPGVAADELIRTADQRMYRVKSARRRPTLNRNADT